jgi:hypothetical protein
MDIAGGIFVEKSVRSRSVTVAIDEHGKPTPVKPGG